jgi:hypothetical protein
VKRIGNTEDGSRRSNMPNAVVSERKDQNRRRRNKSVRKEEKVWLNRHFLREVQMVIKYMIKCSTSLASRETQIKRSLSFHLTQ